MPEKLDLGKRSITAKQLRHAIYKAASGLCSYCGVPLGPDWHVDHVVPYRISKRTNPHECVASCPKCNLSKGAREI